MQLLYKTAFVIDSYTTIHFEMNSHIKHKNISFRDDCNPPLKLYLLHTLQAILVITISLNMSMNLGYCKELMHLQMYPKFPSGQWSCESSLVHSPFPQDKQLHSSSQFIEGTSGSDKLMSKAKSTLPWIRLSNFTPAISVKFCSA